MDENRGPALIGTTLTFGITAFCIVTLRIGFRMYKRRTDASDICLAIALASSLCQEAFNATCVTQWGYGQHKANLPPNIAQSEVPLKLYWLNQIFFKVTTLFTKLSLCIAYLGIFQRATSRLVRWSRIVNYGTALIVVTYYGAAFIVSIFQCTPVSKTWRKKEAGTCIDLSKFRYSTASVNIITSILVIATPLPVLFSMKRGGSEVTQVIILILLGLVHNGCTIARLILMAYPDPAAKKDPQWANLPSNTLSIVEMNIGIIAASLVVMRPFFKALLSTTIHRHPRYRSGNRASSSSNIINHTHSHSHNRTSSSSGGYEQPSWFGCGAFSKSNSNSKYEFKFNYWNKKQRGREEEGDMLGEIVVGVGCGKGCGGTAVSTSSSTMEEGEVG